MYANPATDYHREEINDGSLNTSNKENMSFSLMEQLIRPLVSFIKQSFNFRPV